MRTRTVEKSRTDMGNRISQKGWIVIPAELRRKHGLSPGDEIEFVDYGGVLSLVPVPAATVEAACGVLAGPDSLTHALMEEHRRERETEDAEAHPMENAADAAGR